MRDSYFTSTLLQISACISTDGFLDILAGPIHGTFCETFDVASYNFYFKANILCYAVCFTERLMIPEAHIPTPPHSRRGRLRICDASGGNR